MPKFTRGDKVKVRLDTASPYRGQTGVIDREPVRDSYGFSYMVKFDSRGMVVTSRFNEQDLEKAS